MVYLQWAPCVLMGLLSAFFIASMWLSFIGWLLVERHQGKGHSWCFPVAWGVLGSVACMACPLEGVWQYAWVPLALDPSIGLVLVVMVIQTAMRFVWPAHGAARPEDQTNVQDAPRDA